MAVTSFALAGTATEDGVTYNVYRDGNAEVRVEDEVMVTLAAAGAQSAESKTDPKTDPKTDIRIDPVADPRTDPGLDDALMNNDLWDGLWAGRDQELGSAGSYRRGCYLHFRFQTRFLSVHSHQARFRVRGGI